MKIAVLGSGAMGSLFGGYLSKHNEVWLIDIDQEKIDAINAKGVTIREADKEIVMFPNAISDSSGLSTMDLIIVFVKAMFSRDALRANKHLIGEKTYVMTLQNGIGHEDTLMEIVPKEQIIIGCTKHNSSIVSTGVIHHGGGGLTNIGLLSGNPEKLQPIAENFTKCGFNTVVSTNIKEQLWDKLLLNTSASVLTGILQVKLGYMAENPYAWLLTEKMIHEAVAVANADGCDFDADVAAKSIKSSLRQSSEGYTSIYADLRDGRKSEVDTISGAVVRTAKRLGVPVPIHEFVVNLVHALEQKPRE